MSGTTEKSSAVGNTAKLREALEYAYDTWVKMYEYTELLAQPHLLQVLADAGKMMEAALSAPHRRCDIYTTGDEACKAWLELDHECDDAIDPFGWLFAEAKEGDTENGN